MEIVRYADRPELLDRRFDELSRHGFPEFMFHNAPGAAHWGDLYDVHPEHQLAVLDGDALVAEGHAVPTPWDGTVAGLPAGWDEGFVSGMTSGEPPGALMALAISVHPDQQGQRLSSRLLEAFRAGARAAGLAALIAPVRPTWKHRYPLVPIESYMTWRRDDGTHFDPWLRVHEHVGGRIVVAAPTSMSISAPVADWEEWTGVAYPADGDHILPGGLAPLVVRDGIGTHVEPNVWVVHEA